MAPVAGTRNQLPGDALEQFILDAPCLPLCLVEFCAKEVSAKLEETLQVVQCVVLREGDRLDLLACSLNAGPRFEVRCILLCKREGRNEVEILSK